VRYRRSTGLASRRSAENLAQRAYDAAVLRANGGEPVPTLAELAHAWIEVHRPVSSAAHIRSVELFQRSHMFDPGAKPINDHHARRRAGAQPVPADAQAGQCKPLAADCEDADHVGRQARHAGGDAVAGIHAQGAKASSLDSAACRRTRVVLRSRRGQRTRAGDWYRRAADVRAVPA